MLTLNDVIERDYPGWTIVNRSGATPEATRADFAVRQEVVRRWRAMLGVEQPEEPKESQDSLIGESGLVTIECRGKRRVLSIENGAVFATREDA